MTFLKGFLSICLFISFSHISIGQQSTEQVVDLDKLLPQGKVKVELLTPQVDPSYKELQAKFQQGIEKNPDWWAEYSAKLEPGKEMEYHANFGLKEKEFERLVKGIDMNKLMPEDSAFITITKTAEGQYFIAAKDEKVKDLDSIRIDTKENIVYTQMATFDKYRPVKANAEEMKLTGKWNGHEWKMESVKETTEGSSVKKGTFALGTTEDEKRTILLYEIKETIKGNEFPYADVKVLFAPFSPVEKSEPEVDEAEEEKK